MRKIPAPNFKKMMTTLDIKQALERKGITQKSISDLFQTYPSTISYVISGTYKKSEKTKKIREYIALHLGKKIEEIWAD